MQCSLSARAWQEYAVCGGEVFRGATSRHSFKHAIQIIETCQLRLLYLHKLLQVYTHDEVHSGYRSNKE